MKVIDAITSIQKDSDISEVVEFSNQLYSEHFGQYFTNLKELFSRLQDSDRPITDKELEKIMTMLPLELFSASEALANFKLMLGVIKIKIKQKEKSILDKGTDPAIKKRESISYSMLEDKLLVNVYDSIITRVDKEISFSRELIMTAKKIWDARRCTESVNPINEHNSDDEDKLPDYKPKDKQYIK